MVMEPDDYIMEHITEQRGIESESIRPIIRDLKPEGFVVKAGGAQTVGAGGMVRSSAEGKTDFSLVLDGAMFTRWAEHLTRATRPRGDFPGYPKRNWLKATEGLTDERLKVMERAKESAVRHFIQWYRGDLDEDHAAAVFFNINVHETVKESLR
jgi:hypothetical protein